MIAVLSMRCFPLARLMECVCPCRDPGMIAVRHRRKVPSQRDLQALYGPPIRWHNRLWRRVQRRC